jgi:hypothetical protein
MILYPGSPKITRFSAQHVKKDIWTRHARLSLCGPSRPELCSILVPNVIALPTNAHPVARNEDVQGKYDYIVVANCLAEDSRSSLP